MRAAIAFHPCLLRMPTLARVLASASLLLGAAAPALGAPLGAQTARGFVYTRDSTPVEGAVVSALDPTGAQSGATLTDEFGRFELRVPRPGTWRLQVERVGFARVVSFPFELRTGEALERRVQLREATVRIASFEVRDRARCDMRPEQGTLVATLWDEARKGLAAATAATSGSPLFSIDRDEIEYDSTFRRAYTATRTTTTGRVPQVFRSAPPASLRALGYVRLIDSTTVYFGPDARALLSNDFAATHCFSLAGDDPTSIRRIGLSFTPVGRPNGVVDVAGTLWIDRDTYELDRVEFRFAPKLSEEHPDTTFGGRVHFTRIAGGQVIVRQWSLRMPIFAAADERRAAPEGATSRMLVRASARETITGLKIERGATRVPGERPLSLPDVVPSRGRPGGAPGCDADSLGALGEGWVTGVVRDDRQRAVANAGVRVAWQRADATPARLVFREEWIESAADGQGRFALCGVPRDRELSFVARVRNATRHRSIATLPPSGPLARDLVVEGRDIVVAPTAPGMVRGRVTDPDGKPIAGAQLNLFAPARRIVSDSLGNFRIEALAASTHDIFVRRLGFTPLMASFAVAPGDTVALRLTLARSAQALAPVTVVAAVSSMNLAGFELRREARVGSGQFIGLEELERRRASTLPNLFRMGARVFVESSAATGETRVYGRGGTNNRDTLTVDRCTMRLMIDGALLADYTPVDVLPPVSEIAGIEIYTSSGAIPPQFSFANAKCGLIAVWTRDGSVP